MTASGSTALHHDHEGDDDLDDGHGPAEDPRWVLVPLAVGLAIGLILAMVFGFGSGVRAIV